MKARFIIRGHFLFIFFVISVCVLSAFVITSARRLCFTRVCLFVCLFVCLSVGRPVSKISRKSSERRSMKFSQNARKVTSRN